MRVYVRYTVYSDETQYEVCIINYHGNIGMLFGWWFTGNVQPFAQIVEIKEM